MIPIEQSTIPDIAFTPSYGFYKRMRVGLTGDAPSRHGVYMKESSHAYYRPQYVVILILLHGLI